MLFPIFKDHDFVKIILFFAEREILQTSNDFYVGGDIISSVL